MEIEVVFSASFIVEEAQKYFSFITNENFHVIFKLNPETLSKHLEITSKNSIRDFLILLSGVV